VIQRCSCEKGESGTCGRGQLRNRDEEERSPLGAVSKQRLVKTAVTVICRTVVLKGAGPNVACSLTGPWQYSY
jgi:hypothetical protein